MNSKKARRSKSIVSTLTLCVQFALSGMMFAVVGCGMEVPEVDETLPAEEDSGNTRDSETLPLEIAEEVDVGQPGSDRSIDAHQSDSNYLEWQFSVDSSSPLPNDLVLVWDFGTGDQSIGLQVTYLFPAPDSYVVTVYGIRSTGGALFTLSMTVVIPPGNSPPFADAGEDQSVPEHELVFLYGEGSHDPEGDSITFQWSQVSGPPVILSNAAQSTAHFIAPLVDSDVLATFSLAVSDGEHTSRDTVRVEILNQLNPAATGPTARGGPDQTAEEFTLVILDGSASLPGSTGLPMVYLWTQLSGPPVTLLAINGYSASFVAPDVGESGVELLFELEVRQGSQISLDEVLILVIPSTSTPPGGGGGNPPDDPCLQDSDGDGWVNCTDLCPNDPNKHIPGPCGCGTPDTDSDGDGTPDCTDTCPTDPNKTSPGLCGCQVADTDSDGDGVADCGDICPGHPDDLDLNDNGVPDGCEGPVPAVSPPSLSFGAVDTTRTLEVWNAGAGTLSYALSDNATWLSISGAGGSSDGEHDAFTVTVTRTGLSAGSYQGEISVTPSVGVSILVAVSMTVPSSTEAAPMTAALRTNGVAPLGVFFDVVTSTSGIPAPPLVSGRRDYASYHYEWNFGDDSLGTWLTTGKPKNRAFGFVAAHVFETPGTYRVTLRTRRPDGTSQLHEQFITVQDPEVVFANSSNNTAERTFHVANEGNDANNGSLNQPFRTVGHGLSRLFASNGPRRLLLKRGQTFAFSGGSTINNRQGPYLIGAYGNGARPLIQSSDATGSVITLNANTTDVRIADVDFTASDVGQAIRPGTDMLVLRSRISHFDSGISTSAAHGSKERNLFVDCDIVDSVRYGIYYNFGRHTAFLGTTIDDVNAEHLLRCYITRSLIGHCRFLGGHSAKHQLKFVGFFPTGNGSREPGTPTEEVEYSIVSDNRFLDPGPIDWMITLGPVDDGKDQRMKDVVFERNFLRSDASTQLMIHANNRYITVRNNVFDGSRTAGVTAMRVTRRGVEPPPLGYEIYNNSFYSSNPGGTMTCVRIDSMAQSTIVRNNFGGGLSGAMIEGGGSGLVADHNVFASSPGFVNPAAGIFSLLPGSPAIDAGAELRSVYIDFNDLSRPADGNNVGGAQWDLGAHELGGIPGGG